MGSTTFSGPVQAGTIREGASANLGGAVLSQTATFGFADTGTTVTSIILPANSQIIEMYVDTTVAWDSVTSDYLNVGTAANTDAYTGTASSIDLQATAGRLTVPIDATQAGAIADIGSADVPVNIEITSLGGSLTVGAARLTIVYRQN
jgi:hypothetical protein